MFVVAAWNTNATLTVPSGWTSVGSVLNTSLFETVQVLYRIVQSGDGTSYSFTLSASSGWEYSTYEFSGVDTTTPFNTGSTFVQGSNASATVTGTPTVTGDYSLAAFYCRGQTTDFTPIGSGWTEDSFTKQWGGLQLQHGPSTTANSALTASCTLTNNTNYAACILFLNPSGTSGGGGTITQVQFTNAHSSSSGQSPAFTFTSTPTVGNVMTVWVSWNSNASFTTPTGWTDVGSVVNTSLFSTLVCLQRVVQTGDTSSFTFTTMISAAVSWEVAAYEHSNVNTTTPTDGTNFVQANSASPSVTATPTNSNSFPLAAFYTRSQTTTDFTPIGSGWTDDGFTTGLQAQHGPASGTSAMTATATFSAADNYCAGLVFLNPGSGASGTITLSPTSIAMTYNAGSQTFMATRSGYTGSISATTSDTTVATVIGGGTGSPQTFQVLRQITTGAGGTCTITVTCADNVTASLTVTVYGDLQITSTSATFQPTGTISVAEPNYTGSVSCTLQNQITSVPGTPSLSQTTSGSLPATTYYVVTTYTNSLGETTKSAEASLAVSANNVLVVASPASAANATGWNVYVSTSTGTETLQGGNSIGSSWTLPDTGLVTGTSPPTANTTALCTVSPTSQNATGSTPISFTFTPTNNAYGTQSVSFTDANGISISETVLITGPLTVTPSSLTLNVSNPTPGTITAVEQADPANITATSSNTAVATVSTTTNSPGNSTFTVTPVSAGSCTITVDDHHGATSTVSVTVNGAITASVQSLTFVDPKSAAQTFTISGGTTPYTATSSNTNVATVTVSGATVTVTPVGSGLTYITVQDSETSPAQTTVSVTVGQALSLSTTSLSLNTNTTASVNALNGRSPYTSSSSNTSIATTSVSGSVVSVTGVAAGSATITVTDADGETSTLSVTVNTSLSISPTTMTFASKTAAAQNATVTGATLPITAVTSNPAVCTATTSSNTVTVTPTGPGVAAVRVYDAKNNSVSITNVTVNATSTSNYNVNFSSPFDTPKSLQLSGGTNYTFSVANSSVCNVTLNTSTGAGIISPTGPGTTTITIYDSAGDQCVITVTVASVPTTIPTWTDLQARQLVKFYDPANTSNSFSPKINPVQIIGKPGNVRKYTMTTNGTSVIQGGREYPPKEISLTWNMLDSADYEALRIMQFTNPLVYVDNNDFGYLGVLVIDSFEQVVNVSKKVYKVLASFLVLGPYNGQQTILTQLTPPTLSVNLSQTTGGYISSGTTLYFYSTVTTPWGESTPSPALVYTAGTTTNTNLAVLTFSAPSSTWYRKTRIYWSTTNAPTAATLLTDCLAGQQPQFTVYTNYVAYSTLNPPTYGTAFTGRFDGGRFTVSN